VHGFIVSDTDRQCVIIIRRRNKEFDVVHDVLMRSTLWEEVS